MLRPQVAYTEEKKTEIVRAYQERGSLRAMQRRYGVAPDTLMGWIKKKARQCLSATLVLAAMDDVLERDEMWTFVGSKACAVWLWLALCRRTRQVVADHLGDRTDAACTEFRARLPVGYSDLPTFSDRWSAYAAAAWGSRPKRTQCSSKESRAGGVGATGNRLTGVRASAGP